MLRTLFARTSVLALLPLAASAQNYVFEPLPLPPVTQAMDINGSDAIVGVSFSAGPPQAFLYENGTPAFFHYPGAAATLALAINESGVIGGQFSLTGNPADSQGFLRDEMGNFTAFSYPGTATQATLILGLNNQGDAVGQYNSPAPHGFVRYADGTSETIDYPNASSTAATAIDDQGRIYGIYEATPGAPMQSFILENGVFKDVVIPGTASIHVGQANNRGEFVGNYHPTESNPYAPGGPAYIWERRGVVEIAFPGAEDTDLQGISPYGNIVGSYYPDETGPPFAFVAWRIFTSE